MLTKRVQPISWFDSVELPEVYIPLKDAALLHEMAIKINRKTDLSRNAFIL